MQGVATGAAARGHAVGIPTDEELFARHLGGEGAALHVLMERYHEPLTLYANGYLHDLDAAEDLMLSAFARLLIKRPRLREGGFKPYLYQIARRLALREIRGRQRFLSLDELQLEPEETQQVERHVLETEDHRNLYRALAEIPTAYREALYLVYLEGMSYDDAGAVMRKTRKQVDNLVQSGKRELRRLLEAEGVRLAFE